MPHLRAWPRIPLAIALSALTTVAVGTWVQGGMPAAALVNNLGFVALGAYGMGCAVLAARASSGRMRGTWICWSIALAGWTAANVIWSVHEFVLHREPFPSPADIGYIVFTVFACGALVLAPIGSAGQSRMRLLLDGLIVALSLFMLSWVLVLHSVYETYRADRFALGLALLYPVADLMLIAIAVLVLARARHEHRRTMGLVTAALVAMTLSDTAFALLTARGAYVSGHAVDTGWLVAVATLGAAALLSLDRSPAADTAAAVPTRMSLWLPYLPLLVGGTLTSVAVLDGVLQLAAPAVIVAVCLRQSLASWENRRLLRMVAEQALRDPLTGLANCALFNDRLAHAMALRQRDDRAVAVLSLDLNDFKVVNDSLGHPAGNELLTRVAERMQACVRAGDTVARLGGDEFAVLLEGRVDHSHDIAHRIVEAFDAAFTVDGHSMLMRPSVGLAVAANDEPGLTGDELFKRADAAMYAAKRSRTDGVHVYTAEMRLVYQEHPGLARVPHPGVKGRGVAAVQLLGELRQAIDHLELAVVYQPKFDLATSRVVGAEALLRWPHPTRGLLSPDEFLPLVRRHGLMGAVTELVLAKALDDAAGWSAQGTPVPVAVNLFAPAVADPDLPSRMLRALRSRDLPAGALTVEITEDLFLDDIERTCAVLRQLRASGVRVAIDDFGSGYSALSYLRQLPIDEVKLDRQFIAPITADPRAAEVVRAVVGLAQVLGLSTVAEGVEDAETAERLRDYDCDIAQGFHYSPPLTQTAMLALLRAEVNPAQAPAEARSS
ncbi:bifunctional diguanylate cyclase/phosphodiesterase [Mycobacterium sp. PS03-16]|uniref:putative bifunctional diguanylate cyclase/phosphodiesterase n=1 Tax=Mycobacterium sp. PS03-16 TaxID=2559611 RepID=UPI001FD75B80|nr:bifunctional diguanylate cyclase/phosphodiesterase [Mycobacterium sp. PS03-16]